MTPNEQREYLESLPGLAERQRRQRAAESDERRARDAHAVKEWAEIKARETAAAESDNHKGE